MPSDRDPLGKVSAESWDALTDVGLSQDAHVVTGTPWYSIRGILKYSDRHRIIPVTGTPW